MRTRQAEYTAPAPLPPPGSDLIWRAGSRAVSLRLLLERFGARVRVEYRAATLGVLVIDYPATTQYENEINALISNYEKEI